MASGRESRIRQFLFDSMVETRAPGLALAVVDGDGVCCSLGFGFTDLSGKRSVGPDTVFGIGSVTKLFTAVSIMQLQDAGLLSIDDPVSKHLDVDIRPFGEEIRIGHLMSHATGIPALGQSESRRVDRWFPAGLPLSTMDSIISFMDGCQEWAVCKPGERWFYLNEGYQLMAGIVESITGKPLSSHITDSILKPLGMDRSFIEDVEGVSDVATPYMKDEQGNFIEGYMPFSSLPAPGGIACSINDLAAFARFFIAEGRAQDGIQILSSSAIKTMGTPVIPTPGQEASLPFNGTISERVTSFHGYGLQVFQTQMGTLMGHGGGTMGTTAYLVWMPSQMIGVVMAGNAENLPMVDWSRYVLATWLGDDPDQLPFVTRNRVLDGLIGDYRGFKDTSDASVRRRGDFLELRMHYTNQADRVVPLAPLSLEAEGPLFFTLAGGRSIIVEFRNTDHGTEIIYERYKFRKVGS